MNPFRSEGTIISELTKYIQLPAKTKHEFSFVSIKKQFSEVTEQIIQKD